MASHAGGERGDPTMAAPGNPPAPGHVIEAPRRLAASSLWSVQRRYYDGAGVRAWSSGDVPHLLTSGPIIARAYAELVEALALDLLAGRAGPYDPDAPLVIVELGSGTGRLGYLLSRALERCELGPFRPLVVVTDTVEANLEFMLGHERLAPLQASGRLEVARYSAGEKATLELRASGRQLSLGQPNPVVVIANYFFDVLPQDLYAVREGELLEQHVALCARDPELDPTDPSLFAQVFLATTDAPAEPLPEEEDEALLAERVTEARASGLSEERFLFPPTALATLRAFLELGGGRLLALIGERPGRLGPLEETGDAPVPRPEAEEDGEGAADSEVPGGAPLRLGSGVLAHSPGALLAMGIHGGSMSLPLDLDVVADFARRRDGELLRPVAYSGALTVAAMPLGLPGAGALRHAYRRIEGGASPEDLYLTIKATTDRKAGASLLMLLGALRLGGYDPYLLRQCYPLLEELLVDVDDAVGAEAARILGETEANDYPLAEEPDLALGIAALLAPLGRYELARRYFELAAERRGPSAVVAYNIALCDLHLEDPHGALGALEQALSIEPDYTAAAELRDLVRRELARRAGGGR